MMNRLEKRYSDIGEILKLPTVKKLKTVEGKKHKKDSFEFKLMPLVDVLRR